MMHLSEFGFWTNYISAYLFFTVFTYCCMKTISMHYNSDIKTKNNQTSANSLVWLILLLFFIVLVIFSSFRYIRSTQNEFSLLDGRYYCIGGDDTIEYRHLYEISKGITYFEALKITNKEYLFVFITWIFSNFKISFDFYLVFFNILMFFALIEFCKMFDLRKNSFIPLVALIILYISSFNTLRWSLNLLFTVYFAKNYIKQNLKKCFFIMLIHSGFQFSAIVYIMPIIGALLLKKHKKLSYFFFLICIFICYVPALLDISPLLIALGRRGQADVEGQKPRTWLLIYFVYIFNILIVKKTFFSDLKNKYLFYMILFLMPPTFMELTFGLAYRFAYYSHPILYMHTIYLRKENRKYGYIGLLFSFAEMILIFTIVLKFYYGTGIESSGVPYIFNKNLFWE